MEFEKKGKDARSIPAGHSRDEQIKANTDALAEKAETQFANQGAIDPNKMQVENEVAQHLGGNSRDPREAGRGRISNMVPGYEYLWIRDKPDTIDEAQSRFENIMPLSECVGPNGSICYGFEIVRGTKEDMPEAWERRDARNFRVIGDTILMRAPETLVRKWEAAVDDVNLQQGMNIGKDLLAAAAELSAKHGVPERAFIVNAGPMHPDDLRRVGSNMLREMVVREVVLKALKDGTLPGYELVKRG